MKFLRVMDSYGDILLINLSTVVKIHRVEKRDLDDVIEAADGYYYSPVDEQNTGCYKNAIVEV